MNACCMDVLCKLKKHIPDDAEWGAVCEENQNLFCELLASYNVQLSQASIWVFLAPSKFFARNGYYYMNMFGMWDIETPIMKVKPATKDTPAKGDSQGGVPIKFLFYKTVDHFLSKLGGDNFILFWVKVTLALVFVTKLLPVTLFIA